jgi:hypothetical protein
MKIAFCIEIGQLDRPVHWLFIPNSDLCYTFDVDTQHQIWQQWAERLHIWGMSGIAATFLEASGPFHIFAAQIVYLGQPVLKAWLQPETIQALLPLFEDEEGAESFINILREGP